MNISYEFISEMMFAIRVKSDSAKSEVRDLIEACIKDLEIAGVYAHDANDPLCKQAIKLYCKANYGYDAESEKFNIAYKSLKDSMALCGDYVKKGG